jgi:hypothetical protein
LLAVFRGGDQLFSGKRTEAEGPAAIFNRANFVSSQYLGFLFRHSPFPRVLVVEAALSTTQAARDSAGACPAQW